MENLSENRRIKIQKNEDKKLIAEISILSDHENMNNKKI